MVIVDEKTYRGAGPRYVTSTGLFLAFEGLVVAIAGADQPVGGSPAHAVGDDQLDVFVEIGGV